MVPGLIYDAPRNSRRASENGASDEFHSVHSRGAGETEISHLIVPIGERTLVFPTETEIERQLPVEFPVILHVNPVIQFLILVAVLICITSAGREPQFQGSCAVSGVGAGHGRVRSLGESGGEAERRRGLIVWIS